MSWTSVTAEWQVFIRAFCAAFPHLDGEALRRFRGDRAKLVTYLSEAHDLTEAEACETLTDWFDLNGPRILAELARAA
ncbi:hypothetical protein [Pelagovum pacificum]|uniref:Uncharacterized protein n=1 Tax=Pelagovum pacificum TaxID=2588711 RepID=A0A5C5GBD8_9RHOB|nr:hypothetical protein [Pelagovum pacificum]QQA44780.1 hypothetical protein I8N54_09505 [Pelagovum pacificum]TNY32112.1 hypothetical protein FHY64_02090 [Pelagovum pacificum]